MNKYKFIGSVIGYGPVEKGEVYNEDYHPWKHSPGLTVEYAVAKYPKDWELVDDFDYLRSGVLKAVNG